MVRTLFIDRRRAERQLNVVGDVKADRVALRGDLPGSFAATLKSGRIEVVGEAADLTLIAPGAKAAAETDIAILTAAGESPGALGCHVGIYVCPANANGRAVEIVVERNAPDGERLALALARKLRGTPLITRGGRSVLADLAAAYQGDSDASRAAVAAAGMRVVADGLVQDADLVDVAAVIAGIIPASLGGPITMNKSFSVL